MADTTVTYEKGKLYQLELAQLQTDTNQPRKYLDPQVLEELATSIAQHGVLEPVLFRVETLGYDPIHAHPEPVEGQKLVIVSPETDSVQAPGIVPPETLFIVAGERRFKTAQQFGLVTVPGICVEGNTSGIALVENLLRQDLTAIEEAEAIQHLKEEQKYTDEQLSGVIGKARTTQIGDRR